MGVSPYAKTGTQGHEMMDRYNAFLEKHKRTEKEIDKIKHDLFVFPVFFFNFIPPFDNKYFKIIPATESV